MIDFDRTMEKIDGYFAAGDVAAAQAAMEKALAEALQEDQKEAILPLLNELMGCYRETSQVEASYDMAERALRMVSVMGMRGTLAEATTCLNAANVYRAGGRWEDSLACYARAEKIYTECLNQDDMLIASYHNNISLLYQEMGQYSEAKASLLRALAVVGMHPEAVMEEAVTYANLSATCMELGEEEEGEKWADLAIELFEKKGIRDAHYLAALSARARGFFKKGRPEEAAAYYKKAMDGMEELFGRNEFYARLEENYRACRPQAPFQKGLDLCKAYYENVVSPMLETRFPDWLSKIAAGLSGEGSDCFGWDDESSRDHDWGPDVCLWVSKDTYDVIGKELEEAYAGLPDTFQGYKRQTSMQGRNRRGVQEIETFYGRLLGAGRYEEIDWKNVSDAGLAAAVNGQVFRDDEGILSEWRRKLGRGYPEDIRLMKVAEAAALFSQNLQYNLPRLRRRGDRIGGTMALGQGMESAIRLCLYIEGIFPAHAKGMLHQMRTMEEADGRNKWAELDTNLEQLADRQEGEEETVERMASLFRDILMEKGLILGRDLYLESYVPQLLWRAAHVGKSKEEMAEEIARVEFKAFQNVKNLGGRADCQDDWDTFSLMRRSQYLTWTGPMLIQYLFEFEMEYERGRNLIEEKYARMMESTAPEEYETFKGLLPALPEQARQIIHAIAEIQVGWMEDLAAAYPGLAQRARSIRSETDSLFNTSYETYLRGELGTYSPRMLKLYGNFIVECVRENRNLAKETFENSIRMYGYSSLEEAD